MQAHVISAVVGVPGVRNVLLDLLLVLGIDRKYGREVAVEHGAPRVLERLGMAVAVGREFAVAKIVAQAAAVLGPVLVERGHGQQVGNVHLVDKLVGLADEPRHQVQPLPVDGRQLVDVDGARNAADKVVGMRVLAAEHGVDFDDFLLPLQSIEIVRDCNQVGFRRQLVGRMTPIAVGEDAHAAGGKGLDLVLDFGEIRGGVLVPLRK